MAKKIGISQFKAHCLEMINKLQTDKQPIVITKRDKPIATILPFNNQKESLFGLLKGKAEIKGDIVSSFDEEWEAEQ